MTGESEPITVSRRIGAPAADIFTLLATPARHVDLDGSGMVRAAVSCDLVTAHGDVFVMQMYFSRLGDYEMNNHIVEYEPDRRIGWEPEPGRGHPDASPSGTRPGHRWIFDLVPDGTDATIVTEIYDCSRAPEDARALVSDGRVWTESMTRTLELLDELCVGSPFRAP